MTQYLRRGTGYTPTAEAALDLHPLLPAGNFIIKLNPQTNQLYLDQVEGFVPPSKLYGNVMTRTNRILSTFHSRPTSTGVLLTGEKGSGKTLLAKMLVIEAAKLGVPAIIINHPWHGDEFNQLIQSITQPCIILFDEFEKVYDRDDQTHVLTLLDGVFPSKKLFILTCNDKYRIDAHMRNRPGRIFYALDYKGLSLEFITEYCNDNLDVVSHTDAVCKVSSLFSEFNFDMLKALVEEMNRYKETAQQALDMLNVSPDSDSGGRFDVAMFHKNIELSTDDFSPDGFSANPLTMEAIHCEHFTAKSDDSDDSSHYFTLFPTDLTHVNATEGTFTYVSGAYRVVFKRKKVAQYDFYGALF